MYKIWKKSSLISKSSLLEILCSRENCIYDILTKLRQLTGTKLYKEFSINNYVLSLLSASMLANVRRCFSIFLRWMCRRGNDRRAFSLKERMG